jgi:hypothetical protein
MIVTTPTLAGADLPHLMTLRIATAAPRLVSPMPAGDRMVIDVSGGEFSGDRLAGIVRPSGGDWLHLPPGGVPKLDVRLALETMDAVPFLVRYRGVVAECDGRRVARIAAEFEAPSALGWLNGLLAIGYGSSADGIATYELFELDAR